MNSSLPIETPFKPFLLASDLDGTLIPNAGQPNYAFAIAELNRLMASEKAPRLAYVTGRDLNLAQAGVSETGLPEPDFFVCDVGTSIYHHEEDAWIAEKRYQQKMSRRLSARKADRIKGLLGEISQLWPQAPENQSEFKLSYYFDLKLPENGPRNLVCSLLKKHKIAARPIFSIDQEKNIGLLDILPEGVAKDFALHHLGANLGLSSENIIYAGDSGNDLPAFTCGVNAIVVANTPVAIRRKVKEELKRQNSGQAIFFASKPCAAGVVEGCHHFGLLPV